MIYYVLAGKKEVYSDYIGSMKKYLEKNTIVTKYVYQEYALDGFCEADTLVLLHGWWGRSWAKDAVKHIIANYSYQVECRDGRWGADVRKELFAESIKSSFTRFEMMDFDE